MSCKQGNILILFDTKSDLDDMFETFGVLDLMSTKSSLEKSEENVKVNVRSGIQNNMAEEFDLDGSAEYTTPSRGGGKRGAAKSLTSEPNKLKKSKTASV